MLRWIENSWWGSTPAEFASLFGLSESIERLRAATRRSVFSALARQQAVGAVKESHVSLQRIIPMMGNPFKPFYRGRFIEKNGKVILVGRFTSHRLAKAVFGGWFLATGCFFLLSLSLPVRDHEKATLAPLFGVEMIAAGTALVWIGRWLSRNDVTWLSGVIRSALGPQLPAPNTDASNPGDGSRKQG
jgi:hypothetical protein